MFQLLQPPFPLCAPVLPCMFELVGRKKNTYTGIRKPDSIVGGQTMQRQECVKPRQDAPRAFQRSKRDILQLTCEPEEGATQRGFLG